MASCDVFISYSQADYKDKNGNIKEGNIISSIKKALDDAGISYWIDELGLSGGMTFSIEIEDRIKDAKVFLFVSSENSNKSQWVMNEVALAHRFGKRIIPFRLDNSEYANGLGFFIQALQYISHQDNPNSFDDLIQAIKTGSIQTVNNPKPKFKKIVWISGVVFLTIVLGLSVAWHIWEKPLGVDETDNLLIYYPNFSRIDLICGEMPDTTNPNIIFCSKAAYTSASKSDNIHDMILGTHVAEGILYEGYEENERNTGTFVWYNGRWKFLFQPDYREFELAVENDGVAFCQEMFIHDGAIKASLRDDTRLQYLFKALCEIDGKLCVIQNKQKSSFYDFVMLCCKVGATEALYLDLDEDWLYSWYREKSGKIHGDAIYDSTYCSNWITFYK